MLKHLKNTKKQAWIVIGVSFVLVIASAGMVYTDLDTAKSENKRIEGLKTKVRDADLRISKIRGIESRVLRERVTVDQYAKILPDDDDINTFVDRITEFANDSGVEISSLNDESARRAQRRRGRETFVKIVYKMELKGTVAQFLDFINKFETHRRFVRVNTFSIKSGKDENVDPEGHVQHDISLELETYVYNPRGKGAKTVKIINAEKKMATIREAQGDLLQRLDLETYEYVAKPDRPDPFADPRISESGAADAAKDVAQREKELKDLVEELGKLTEAVEAEKQLGDDIIKRIEFAKRLNRQLIEFKQRIEDLRRTDAFKRTKQRNVFQDEVVEPFAKLLASRPQLNPENFRLQEIEAQLKRMKLDYSRQKFEKVVATGRTLLSTARDLENAPPRLQKVYDRVAKLVSRAEAHEEFARLPLRFSGIVYEPARPKNAVIIINDRAYSPGDVMDDGVVVSGITPDRIVFHYKGVEIERPLD